MTDNEITKALEYVIKWFTDHGRGTNTAVIEIAENALDLIKRLQTKNKEFDEKIVMQRGLIDWQKAEVEQWEEEANKYQDLWCEAVKDIQTAKSEAIKEFAEKINEIFLRYAHLHSHSDCARKDYIKTDDGTNIEMQSVWDVFTLKKYGIAEYTEMNRLQDNIGLIEKGRLLAELEKDFRLLVKKNDGGIRE